MYKKIDFRVRPPYGNYLTMFQNEQAHFARLADAFDMTAPNHSAREIWSCL